MEGVEKVLWEQVKSMPIEGVQEEVKGWVVDSGMMAGRASAHDRLVMLYWVIMNLVTHSALNVEAKLEEKMEDVAKKRRGMWSQPEPRKNTMKRVRLSIGISMLLTQTSTSCTVKWTR